MSKELKRMQKLAGVPVNEKKESINEVYVAGGIVGVGAITQIPPREKSDYEMAFEHFMNEERKSEMDPGEITGTDIDDIEISSPPDFGDDEITGTDIDDIKISSPPDLGDDEITGTRLEGEEGGAMDVKNVDKFLPKINTKAEYMELLPKILNLDVPGVTSMAKATILRNYIKNTSK